MLEKKELVAMVRPFPLKAKEKIAMIMTITSPLLERKEMVAMVILFPLKEKEGNVMIMTIPRPFLERKSWWPWSYHPLF